MDKDKTLCNTYSIKQTLNTVYNSLDEKKYNPLWQLSGYLLSGDPSYITSHNNSRHLISKYDRDVILEELLKNYFEKTR